MEPNTVSSAGQACLFFTEAFYSWAKNVVLLILIRI